MLDTLFYVVQKNMRLVFRNWTSFALLVLGPMLLIFIVGFAFSGDDLHDITVGIHAPRGVDVSTVVDSLASDEVGVLFFPRIDACISSMNRSSVHICAEFSPKFEETGDITFYYDATRYNLVRYILEYLQEQIAVTSEEISLELAEQIFADINGFVTEMETAQVQVADLRSEALLLREDLVFMYDEIVAAREQFEPRYFAVKESQETLNQTVLDLTGDYANATDVTTVITNLELVSDTIDDLSLAVESIESFLSSLGVTYDLSSLEDQLDEAQNQLEETIDYLNDTGDLETVSLDEAKRLLHELDLIVGYLDAIYDDLLATEVALEEHIDRIDSGVEDLDGISTSLEDYIAQFSEIDEDDAETFLNPISATFVALPGEEETGKIQLVFPMLLVFMIAFISILLANMLVLNETHSPAYFRNFLVPTNHFVFIFGLFLTTLLLISFQIAVLLLVAYLSFGVNFFLNIPTFAFGTVLAIIVFVQIGMIFGYLVRARQTSLLLSLFSSLILFFFSDIVFPLEIMPEEAAFIAQFSPLVLAESIFRQTLFFGHGIDVQAFAFSALCLYALFFGVLVIGAFYWNRSRR